MPSDEYKGGRQRRCKWLVCPEGCIPIQTRPFVSVAIDVALNNQFDLVVYQARLPDGSRKITGIGELKLNDGLFDLDIIYKADS